MKKLFLVFTLLPFVLFGQLSNTNVWMMRGDSKTLSFNYNGNVLNDTLIFVVKSSKNISAVRLINKTTYDNQISILFGVSSFIYVRLDAGDTDDLTLAKYYYDITRIHNGDTTTILIGELNLQPDIGTPFDGTDVVGRVTTVSLNNGTIEHELVWWDDNLNYWAPSGITLSTSGSVGNADSLGGKPASEYLVKADSTNQRTFSDLKYVDKSSAQTITGEKTFSNNKTVFGTTTNDSVGIRGKLDVDGISTFGGNVDFAKRFRVGDYTVGTNSYLSYTPLQSLFYMYNTSLFLLPPVDTPTPDNKNIFTAADYVFLQNYPLSIYSFGGLATDGRIYMNNIFQNPDTSILRTIVGYEDTLKINSAHLFINGNPYSVGGSVSNADSLIGIAGTEYQLKSPIDNWSTNLSSGTGNELRLGKSYNTKRFNEGIYPDVWNIDYVIPPYNLSANWLYPIEHRTDYYNDTLNTVAHSDILNIDGTGTPRWKTNDVKITGNQIEVNVGDVPDSTTLDWASAGLFGNNVIIGEANKTGIGSTRFPMPVYGYNFKFGSSPDYRYPYVYGFYSDLTANSPHLETAYHFYGKGNFPSYFGGDIQMPVGSLVTGSVTLSQAELGYVDGVTSSIQTQLSGKQNTITTGSIGATQIASTTVTAGSYTNTNLTVDADGRITAASNGTGGSGFDSTYVYQAISAKQATLVSGTNIKTINSTSILGSGNITISGSSFDTTFIYQAVNAKPSVSTVAGMIHDSLANGSTSIHTLAEIDTAVSQVSRKIWEAAIHDSLANGVTSTHTLAQIDASVDSVTNAGVPLSLIDNKLNEKQNTITTGSIGATQIASTSVTAGSYTNTNLTVDADGRITSASNGTGGSGFDSTYVYQAIDALPTTSEVNTLINNAIGNLDISDGYYVAKVESFSSSSIPMVINPQDSGDVLIITATGTIPQSWQDGSDIRLYYGTTDDIVTFLTTSGTGAQDIPLTLSGYVTVDDTGDVNFGLYALGNGDLLQQATVITLKRNAISSSGGDVSYSSVDSLKNRVTYLEGLVSSLVTTVAGCCDLSDNTPPAKPTSLVAYGGEYLTQVRMTWADPSDFDLDSIRIYRNSSNDTTTATWIASVNEAIGTYTNTSLSSNTTYWYWVKALDDSSNLSYFSVGDSATTLAISGGGIGAAFDSAGTTGITADGNTLAFDYSAQVGVNYTSNTGNKTLGAVGINIDSVVGDSSASILYQARIHLVGGSNSLGTLVATSTSRTLSAGWCRFDFTSGVTLTAGTEYYIVVSRVSKYFSGDEYAMVNYGTNEWTTGVTGVSCNAQSWYGNGTRYDHYDNPYTFRLYVWE